MNIDQHWRVRLIDLNKYRIVDLSVELRPGIRKVNGEYIHGEEIRRLELRQFIYAPDKCYMHWVETETHIGTHVEGPSHHPEGKKSVAELPLTTFMGEAVVLDMSHFKPIKGRNYLIKPKDLEEVKEGDIVLMWSALSLDKAPRLSDEVCAELKEKNIKMLGLQNIGLESPGVMEKELCANNIPVVEGIINLDKLKKDRVFFIGLPLKILGLDSSWIRAIALEEL